jgi:thioesterase domain-containing protein/acyl carrier protein
LFKRLPSLPKEQWNEAALRKLLIDLLAETLEVDGSEIDPAKSFDECGLDSIAAVIATGPLGERLGLELTPEFLFKNNSIDEVVQALLDERGHGSSKSPPAGVAPIFMFPGGGVRDYNVGLVRFRARCAPDLAFEVISSGDWRDWLEQDLDFDSLVRRACRQIEDVAPEGPLSISAYSQGGYLAFASAIALSQEGRRIKFMGLLDPGALSGHPHVPSGFSEPLGVLRGALRLAIYWFVGKVLGKKYFHRDGSTRLRAIRGLWFRYRGHSAQIRLLRLVVRFSRLLFHGPGGARLDLAIQLMLFESLWSAWIEQKRFTTPFDWPIFLFRSRDPGEPDRGWGLVCSNLRIVPVDGGHLSMFDAEHLDGLVGQFEAAYRRTNSVETRKGAVARG